MKTFLSIVKKKQLEKLKALRKLELHGNKIDTEGVQAIANMLKGNKRCLKILSLVDNDIGDDGAKAIVGVLTGV